MSVANIRLILSHCPSYHSLFLSNECTRVLLNKSKLKKKKKKRGGGERGTNQMKAEWPLFAGCGLAPTGPTQHVPFYLSAFKLWWSVQPSAATYVSGPG